MQHEFSSLPLSLGYEEDYHFDNPQPLSKDRWTLNGEITSFVLDEIEHEYGFKETTQGLSSFEFRLPSQDDSTCFSTQTEAAIEPNTTIPSLGLEFYHENIDLDSILLAETQPSSPVSLQVPSSLESTKKGHNKIEKDIENSKKNKENDGDLKRKHQDEDDSDDQLQPTSRKEKNKIAAKRYRAKLRKEADNVVDSCDKLVRENSQIKGEIDTLKKEIDRLKALLEQLNK